MIQTLYFLEISFSKVIPELELLAEVSRVMPLDRAAMWNWSWAEEAPDYVYTNVSYSAHDDPTYPLFVTLNFNQPPEVPVGFEVEIGYALAHYFNCSALINDFSYSEGRMLEIQSTGQVMACVSEDDAQGQTCYYHVSGPMGTYQQVIQQLQVAAQQEGYSDRQVAS
jgi:hypothetical protein